MRSETVEAPAAEPAVGGTLIAHAIATIKQRIAARSLTPGAQLPSIRALAQTLKVSKSTIVEAYEYQWFRFDNDRGTTEALCPPARATERAIPLPATEGAFLMVRVRTLAAGLEAWKKAVDVFLRTVGRPSVVGVERER